MSEARPVKVIHLLTRMNVGGLAVLVTLLCRDLRPRFQTILATGRVSAEEHEGDMAYYALERGVEPLYVPGLWRRLRPLDELRALVSLYRLFRRERPDVLHTHQAKAGIYGGLIGWLARVPVRLRTFHGHAARGYFGRASGLYILLERLIGRLNSAQVTLTEELRDEVLQLGFARPDQLVVIPYGLELDEFAAAPRFDGATRRALGVPDDVPLIGFCGRFQRVKRPDLFVEVAARVHAALPAAHFAMLGDGELRADIAAQVAARGLSEVVHLLGFRKDVAAVMADWDLIVNLASMEGTPLVLLEAAAAGVPAVASAVGGCRSCIEDGRSGWLVPYKDIDATVAAVLAAVRDRTALHAVGEYARARVLQQHGEPARMAAAHAALYERLLARRGQCPKT